MKASELRIGNYIFYNGDTEFSEVEWIMWEKPFNPKYYKPIPLTEEWLLKFGWEWDIFYQGYFGHNHTMFPNYEGGWRISYSKTKHDYIVRNIQYVHQLQNLYFALTGEELTI